MTVRTALAAGRRAKARRMTSTCLIERPGVETTNMATGVVTTPRTTVYDGPCYLPRDQVETHEGRLGDVAAQTAQRARVELPWDTTGPRKDDVVTITASATPANVGRELRVTAVATDEDATALRLSVEELT